MLSILISLFLATMVTAAVTPLVRRVAWSVGAVDAPDARRVNTRRIPRMGGVAIVTGFFSALLAIFAANTHLAQLSFGHTRLIAGLLVGSLLVTGLGVVDDVRGVGAKRKLLVQATAATVAYAAGFRISAVSLPLLGTLEFGWMALPLTVLWITAIINALNLIDGLDGLAAGVAFFACVANFVTGYLGSPTLGNYLEVCLLAATLAGAIVGFLFHNFHPATIFMGDSGSMFLGFVLAVIPLFGPGTHKGGTAVGILVPLLALGLPITDMLLAMVRRFLERRSIFAADRGHLHHRLLDLGLTHRRAVFILYGTSVAFTLGALVIYIGRSTVVGLALLSITVIVVGMVRAVGYFSFRLAEQEQRTHRSDPIVQALRRAVPQAVAQLDLARGVEEIPGVLETFSRDAGLVSSELQAGKDARLPSWSWARDEAARADREPVAVRYSVSDSNQCVSEMIFRWDDPNGEVSAQSEILLQLVADATERLLQRQARAREATRSGRLSVA